MPKSEDELIEPSPLGDEHDYSAGFGVDREGPWRRPIEVDKTLLLPRATSRVVRVTIPIYEETEVATPLLDKDGEQVKNGDGALLYEIRKAKVFRDFQSRQVKLPGEEIFNVDLTSSYLGEYDVPALRALISLFSDLQWQVLQGKNRIADLQYVYNKIMGIVETAKARNGQTARLSKTTISEGTSKQQIIAEYEKEKQKRQWIPGNF